MDEVAVRLGIINQISHMYSKYNEDTNSYNFDVEQMLRDAADIEAFVLGGDDGYEGYEGTQADYNPDAIAESPGYARDRKTFEDFQRDAQRQFDYSR